MKKNYQEEHLRELIQSFKKNPSKPEELLDACDKIILSGKHELVPLFLSLFDDNTHHGWVLESLQMALEHFPQEVFLRYFLPCLHKMIPQAIGWAANILYPFLNDEISLCVLRQNLHLAPREALLELFDLMDRESPHHRDLLFQLRQDVLKLPENQAPEY